MTVQGYFYRDRNHEQQTILPKYEKKEMYISNKTFMLTKYL